MAGSSGKNANSRRSIALLVLSSLAPQSWGQGDAGAQQLARVQGEIVQLESDRERLRREEQGVLGKLVRLEADARLLDARREEAELIVNATRRELTAAEARVAVLQAAIEESRARFRAVVLIMQRAGPLAPLRPLLTVSRPTDLAPGLRTAHELARRQVSEVRALRAATADLVKANETLEQRRAAATAAATKLQAARDSLQQAIGERRALLAAITGQRTARDQALTELRRASDAIEALIARGTAEGAAAVTLDVTRFRGLLARPPGKLRRGFGDVVDPRLGTRLPHPGWDLDLPFGERVGALFDGRVVFADWFRGYGLTVVVDHGHSVHSVYAHLSAIITPVGTKLTKGQVIGRVGDTGSLEGAGLYLELRVNGKAQDPAPWFAR